jgi:hypothetical protein
MKAYPKRACFRQVLLYMSSHIFIDNRRDWTTGEIRKSLECLGNAR